MTPMTTEEQRAWIRDHVPADVAERNQRLDDLLAWLEAQHAAGRHSEWDQSYWFGSRFSSGEWCGTTMCAAGYACVQAGLSAPRAEKHHVTVDGMNAWIGGQAYLGLDNLQAETLFKSYNLLSDMRAHVEVSKLHPYDRCQVMREVLGRDDF